MQITPLLKSGGYIHRPDLISRRWSADGIRRAVRREGLVVLRRQWIVHPTCPEPLKLAASTGGRVTCITAAKALGLWVSMPGDRPHIALPPHSGEICPQAVVHRAIGVTVPERGRLVDTVENVLALVARCLDEADALATWESAIRTGLVSVEHLRAVRWTSVAARRLAALAGGLSDSGLESLFVHRLRRIGVTVQQQVFISGHHIDALVGSRLALQTDGFEHHKDRAQRRADIAHDRALRLLGYTVFRYAYEDVMFDWPRVEAEIRSAMSRGLHLSR